jgi:hypothetical protein
MIEIVDQGHVYRNPKPYLRSIHAWHPSLVRLDNGELLASFDLAEAVEALNYRTWLARSTDDGRTWSTPTRLLEDNPAEKRPVTHTIRIGRTRDGEVTGIGALQFRTRPDEGLVNRENLGYTEMEVFTIRSSDGGRTFSAPLTIKPPLAGPGFETCHPIMELSDGRWLAPTSTWRGWDGDEPNGMQAVAFVSHDRGRTWPDFLAIANRSAEHVICWEVSVVELSGGRLVAVCWAFNEKTGRSLPNIYSYAADGVHFTPPVECGLVGQTAKLCVLADGRILCLYRRENPPGLWAQIVSIEDGRWVNQDEAVIWQGASSAGMSGRGTNSDELSGLKFGYPSPIRLPNGDIMAVFWCVEDSQHVIRWVRLRTK